MDGPVLMLLALVTIALAQDDNLTDTLSEARKAMGQADFAAAKTRLYEAEGYMPRSAGPLPGTTISQVPFLFGVIAWQEGDREVAMDWWRKAVVMAPKLSPERAAFPDMEAQDVFHAIVEEIANGDEVVLTVPGDAPGSVWVDGVERMDGDSAPLGRHLVQVRCDDGHVTGAWYELGAPPADWFVICDGSPYPKGKASKAKPAKSSAKPAPVAKADDDLDEPAPKAAKTSSRPAPADDDLDEPAPKKAAPQKSTAHADKGGGGFGGKDVAGVALLGVGAVGGVATWWTYESAVQANDSWQAKKKAVAENPELEPAKYHDDVVVPRYTLFYGTAAGTALLLAGGVTLVLVDEGPTVLPIPGGGALLWNARF